VALAEQLANLLDDHEQRSSLSRAGQAAVHREFTAAKMAENTLAALQTILTSHAQ
jgi:glycosyltransferase involved in cell wall biosynthesis